jgi:hypothetical protein
VERFYRRRSGAVRWAIRDIYGESLTDDVADAVACGAKRSQTASVARLAISAGRKFTEESHFNRGSRVGVLVAKITSSSRTRIRMEIRSGFLN